MKPKNSLRYISNAVDAMIKAFTWFGYVVLGLMVLLIVGSVVTRTLLHAPLLGVVELVELMMVIIGFFAMSYTAMERGHVRVDLVTSRLSMRTQAILSGIAFSLGTGIFGIIAYQAIVQAIYYVQHLGEATTVLSIPFAPFRSVMALGFLLICLRSLIDISHFPLPEKERKGDFSK